MHHALILPGVGIVRVVEEDDHVDLVIGNARVDLLMAALVFRQEQTHGQTRRLRDQTACRRRGGDGMLGEDAFICGTELGEKNDRIHLHGIFFGQKSAELIRKHWKYGFVFIGGYCNSRSVNYMTKYMLKVDIKHPEFKQIVLASKGIGSGYMDRLDYLWQKQNYERIEVATYTFRNGTKMAMPKYYKDKIFTEKEREKMWINNLNRGLLWVYGEKIKADDWGTIDNLRSYWQRYGREVMGDNPIAWNAMKERRKEEKQRRAIAETKKLAEKFSTKILTGLPLKVEFSMQENDWDEKIYEYWERNKAYMLEKHDMLLSSIGM